MCADLRQPATYVNVGQMRWIVPARFGSCGGSFDDIGGMHLRTMMRVSRVISVELLPDEQQTSLIQRREFEEMYLKWRKVTRVLDHVWDSNQMKRLIGITFSHNWIKFGIAAGMVLVCNDVDCEDQ